MTRRQLNRARLKDIGERSRAQEARARLAAIVESSDDAIVGKTLDGIITSWNRGAEQIFGYTAREAAGQHISLIIPEDRRTEDDTVLARVRRGEKVDHFETERLSRDGRRLSISLTVSPIRNATGTVTGASMVARDITERKRSEAIAAYQSQALQMLAEGTPLKRILEFLIQMVERDSTGGLLGSIVPLNEAGTHFQRGIGSSLPEGFNVAVEGIAVSSFNGICCHAVAGRTPVIVSDFTADPRWSTFAEFVAPYGLRSGWSTPVFGSDGSVLATFANYYRDSRDPTPEGRQLVDVVTRTAAIAIERTRAEEAARYRAAQFETLINRAPLGVYVVDQDFRIAQVNPIALPVFGEIPDLIGRDFEEVIHILWTKDYADEIVRLFRHTLETGESYVTPERAEFRIDRQKNEYYEWRIDRLLLPDGHHGVVCYFRDISSYVQARLDAQGARQQAEAANRAKSEFLASMSHELRTPLNAIIGYAELMEIGIHGALTEGQRGALSRMRQSGQHLITLISDVLDFAKIEAGVVKYDIGRVPIDELLASLEALIAPQIAARELRYLYERVDASITARADAEKVKQIVVNLLTNAIKFTPPGGEIRVTCVVDDGHVVVAVSDTGPGIAPDKLDVIFEPFVQADRKLSRPIEGLGLGLAISREMTRAMDGDVRVESIVGRGSTFTLLLPRASKD